MTLRLAIAMLYGEDRAFPNRIEGGPGWLDTERFDIEGKVAEGDPPEEALRLMAQRLLEDRFQLRIRKEPREGPVYLLMPDEARVEGIGDGLRPSTGSDCVTDAREAFATKTPRCGAFPPPEFGSEALVLRAAHVSVDSIIATVLRGFAGRPVINRTNLAGNFSFELRIPRPPAAPSDFVGGPAAMAVDWGAAMPDAVREQWGLRMVSARGPWDVLVIESVQRPTEN